MRNPFVPIGAVPVDKLAFIVATRGGSAWLYAGALFWAVGGVTGALATPDVWVRVLLVEPRNPALIPAALTIVDGAHLLVLMWVQLDYAYSLQHWPS
jgi:hypothetical protein